MNEYAIHRSNAKPMQFDLEINELPNDWKPLVLLINPTTLEIKFTPKVTEQRVRWNGLGINPAYIFQAHHDELDVLTASGRSAMFMIDDKGLTRLQRSETYAYDNIEKLVMIYRNNGVNRNKTPNSSVRSPCAIDSVGRVSLTYNGYIYRGYFMSLSVTENDTSPFNVDFNFEFKVFDTFNSGNING